MFQISSKAYQDFVKDPIKYLTFLLLGVVSFLYFQNDKLHKQQYVQYEKEITSLKHDIAELKDENRQYLTQLRKSDSALSSLNSKLDILSKIKSPR